MSSNYISESISLVRNLKKATKGDKIATFCAVGNVVKVTEKLAKIDNGWGTAAKGVVDSFTKAAENSGRRALQVVSTDELTDSALARFDAVAFKRTD